MVISSLAALIGCVLTGMQAVLIYLQGTGICLNEGCEIVDSLTRVDPLYFNIAGFFFFLVVWIGIGRARKGSDTAKSFVSLLLLAALGGEAVLLLFQYKISQAYCSYCLIVLALVIIANVFLGLKQVFKGLFIFLAVAIAFLSLDFTNGKPRAGILDDGTFAYLEKTDSDEQLYLFFSSTCTYCESVIETLKEDNDCNVRFNPIDTIDAFTFQGTEAATSYNPEINVTFLRTLGIDEIPVLLSKTGDGFSVITGTRAIISYIRQQCGSGDTSSQDSMAQPSMSQSSDVSIPLPVQDEGCSIDEECAEEIDPALPPQ